jgi:hypothetical protein
MFSADQVSTQTEQIIDGGMSTQMDRGKKV